jgi:hypothetical protein
MVDVSLHYELSPVQRLCPACLGYGRIDFILCTNCDGTGRTWIAGGPSFGCKLVLSDVKRGQIATLGNHDRGRVLRHCERGPVTEMIVIDPMFDVEDVAPTWYPSETGVISVSAASWFNDDSSGQKGRGEDLLDPLHGKQI